ncbi:MAG: hypothetical protein QM706_00120 [Nitrospira sp.]
MKSNTTWVCILSIGMTLVIAGAESSAKTSNVEPISEKAPILIVQVPVTPEPAPLIGPIAENARILVGHWRKTTIVFEQPKDEHLVLRADGTMENWTVTVSSRSATAIGQWNVEGKNLQLQFEEKEHISQPFTIHEGQLVFPNIPNRRRFWERIER